MSFTDFMFGVLGTSALLMILFPLTFRREHPILSFLTATVAVDLILMPLAFLLVYYFGGYL